MKKQHVLILFFVFVGLFAITKGVEYLGREKTQVKVRDVVKVDADRADQIELTTDGEPIVLQKTADVWSITTPINYAANQAYVQSMLSSLVDLKSDNIVSTNPANQANYQVDEAQGTGVVVSAGSTELANLVIGKLSSDGNSTYVRQKGSDDIHAIRGSVRSLFVRPLTDWRDRTILSVSKEALTQIQLVHPESSLTLTRSGETWQLNDQEAELQQDKIDTLLAQTSLLTATGFVDNPETLDISLETPNLSASLTDQSGKTTSFSLYSQGSKYYLKQAEGEQLFVISSYTYDAFDLSAEALIATEEAAETTQTAPTVSQ